MKTQQQFTIFMRKMVVLCIFAMPVKAISATLYVATNGTAPNDGSTWEHAFTTIQAAINAANNGDIIIVGSSDTGHGDGVYKENVDVNKSLTIKSESGSENTTVKAANAGDHVFEITANNVTIGGESCGFSIYGATGDYMAGIYLIGSTGCTIQDNHCGLDSTHNNYYGIYLRSSSNNALTGNTASSNNNGFYLYSSCNANTLTGNTASSNYNGIYLYSSSNNTLTGNTAGSNDTYGIYLHSSINNTLANNNASNNTYGIYLYSSSNNTLTGNTVGFNNNGIYLSSASNNTLTDNTATYNDYDGICLYYLCNANSLTGNTAESNTNGIYLYSSSNNTLTGNTATTNDNDGIYLSYGSNANTLTSNTASSNNYYGIYLSSSIYNTLTGNTANSNYNGIYLYSSSKNTLTGNTVSSNNYYGIYLYYYSNNNTIYLNNLSGNTGGNTYVESSSSSNNWNSPTPIYYDYTSGSFHKNYLGNYYSDYTGSDADGDGIGTDPYNGTGMTDNYPLMTTSEHYSLQAWWLNTDGKMYRDDRTKACGNVTLNAGNSQIWIASEVATKNISYSGNDTWTGQIVFIAALANGDEFTVEIGSSTDGNDFISGGPQAIITGDGSKTIFTFETNAAAFNLTNGNYLALRLTNNSSAYNHEVQTGGARSYCSSAEIETEPPTGKNENILPNHFSLSQNQPNPFVTTTIIRYELPERSSVTLKVYDLFGREVTTLFEGEQNAGKYDVEFNGTNLPGGIYFYQLQTGNFRTVRKLLLLK